MMKRPPREALPLRVLQTAARDGVVESFSAQGPGHLGPRRFRPPNIAMCLHRRCWLFRLIKSKQLSSVLPKNDSLVFLGQSSTREQPSRWRTMRATATSIRPSTGVMNFLGVPLRQMISAKTNYHLIYVFPNSVYPHGEHSKFCAILFSTKREKTGTEQGQAEVALEAGFQLTERTKASGPRQP